MLVGFMLGVLIRNSAGAIVGYFVYSLRRCRPLTCCSPQNQDWFQDLQPWVDFNYAQGSLFDGVMTGADWAQLAVTGAGLAGRPAGGRPRLVLRSEVK